MKRERKKTGSVQGKWTPKNPGSPNLMDDYKKQIEENQKRKNPKYRKSNLAP